MKFKDKIKREIMKKENGYIVKRNEHERKGKLACGPRKLWEFKEVTNWLKDQYDKDYYLLDIASGIQECIPEWAPHFKKIYATDLWASYTNIPGDFGFNQLEFLDWAWADINNVVKIPCNCERLPFSDNLFDVATSVSSIEHFGDPIKGINEALRVLKPGGFFIFIVEYQPNPERLFLKGNNNEAIHMYKFGLNETMFSKLNCELIHDKKAPEQFIERHGCVPWLIVLRKNSNILEKKALIKKNKLNKQKKDPVILTHKNNTKKVFGIGVSRTGTYSLTLALRSLGYKSHHWPHLPKLMEMAEAYDALTDTTVSFMYKELAEKYPLAKFILTTRNIEEMLNSIERLLISQGRDDISKVVAPWTKEVHEKLYGMGLGFDKDTFRKNIINHEKNVKEYFKDQPGRLLILDIDEQNKMDKLCSFLGRINIWGVYPDRNKGIYLPKPNKCKGSLK